MLYSRSSYGSLPTKPGVYTFLDENNDILYVGKAKDLRSRVSSYFVAPSLLEGKTVQLVSHIKKIRVTVVESELESLLLEAFYIKKFKPKYNIKLIDSKMYPVIKITVKDEFPAVILSRRVDDPKSIYFGPFPSTSSVKTVLKTVRRVFPFMSTTNHPKRICLYNHLKLCPCLPVTDTPENRKTYRKNILQIIRIFEGESRTILKEMEKERDNFSKKENYEEANILQKRISALSYIIQPVHQPFEYDTNPNLREDIRTQELTELQKVLIHNGYTALGPIKKIECYDISHVSGTFTTASMVVFVHGEKESSLYRKYKIRLEKTPDDFASMREVLTRRLKHSEWEYPELFIVDGGKGQVSAALEVFKENGIEIPLIGLAKREETLVIPLNHPAIRHSGKQSDCGDFARISANRSWASQDDAHFLEVLIPKRTHALQLMMRIRDEAHRFAITFHRQLRSKAFLPQGTKVQRSKGSK